MDLENSSSSLSVDSPYKLDNLPNDIYDFYLFELLDLDDVFKLKLVSKALYSKVKAYDCVELSFVDFLYLNHVGYETTKDKWFSKTKSIKLRSQFDIFRSSQLNNLPDNFLNLKYLKVRTFEQENSPLVKTEDINRFSKLQVLHISHHDPNSSCLLQLPNLKALSIHYGNSAFNKTEQLVIDTPKLHSFSIKFGFKDIAVNNRLKFIYPLSVKFIETFNYENNMTIFKNLECLETWEIKHLTIDDLKKFENLKSLKIDSDQADVRKLIDLFQYTLEKNGLEFILFGVKIKNVHKINEYAVKNKHKFQMNNYADLDDNSLDFVKYLYYGDLEPVLPSNQPADLFRKYTNVVWISISARTSDENRLINFIKGSHNLNSLEINGVLNQQFYDQLPVIATSLAELKIRRRTNLNFEFVIKLPYLICLNARQYIQVDRDLNNLKRLREIVFRIDDNEIEILRESRDRYQVYCETVGRHNFNLDQLIEWINNFRENN